jgi:adenylate cyclase
MQRRGGSEQPVKGRRNRTIRPKARKAPTAHLSTDDSPELFNHLKRERDEALEQLSATSEVLQVISQSTFDLQSVLFTLVRTAGQLCQADNVQIFLRDGEVYRLAADNGFSPEYQKYVREHPIRPGPNTLVARTALEGEAIHIHDTLADPEYTFGGQKLGGYRTVLGVPMIRDENCIGVIALTRSKVHPFTDNQIKLVTNFAAQALVAIENTRLLNELRQRTDDLSESLEQQTATSEVLQVISSSSGELAPVFESLLVSAKHLCGAEFGIILLREGDAFRTVALHGTTAAYTEARWRAPFIRPAADTGLGRVLETKQVVQIADVRAVAGYVDNPVQAPIVQLAGVRSKLSVPMLKEEDLIGVIEIDRQEVRPFTDKQIELVKNFAAQAVIAIENARLLNDLNKLNQQLEQRVTDQVNEIERMGRLRRFLPPQVADLIVASGSEKQLESHRREITALFCDLRGFTGFSESSDPEDVMALLREYHAAIGEIINKYGGTLERYAGDGVMVVFNDPIPVDNPALQAVLMAIDMRAVIGTLIERWRKLGHDIGFGIGIAHGFATLGTIGFEGRFDYAAIGTVSNVASRLCDEAKPGQILISPRVLMAVEKNITVEPVGDFALKGIRRPLAAYNVLATRAED